MALEKNGQTFLEREIRVKTYQYNPDQKLISGKKNKKKKNSFQKESVSPVRNSNNKDKTKEQKMKPKKNSNASVIDFKGEISSKKKLIKKTKNRIKNNRLDKQKKKIAEILSK